MAIFILPGQQGHIFRIIRLLLKGRVFHRVCTPWVEMRWGREHLRILPTMGSKFFNGNTHEHPSPFLVFWLYLSGKGNEGRALRRVLHDEQAPSCRERLCCLRMASSHVKGEAATLVNIQFSVFHWPHLHYVYNQLWHWDAVKQFFMLVLVGLVCAFAWLKN